MSGVACLCEADFLERARRSPLARLSRGRLGVRAAAGLRSSLFLLAAFLLYAPPLLRAPGPLPGLLGRPEAIADLSSIFFASFGLFAGAWLVCDHVLGPNERMLAFPIRLRDLARFRLIEAGRSALAAAVFFVDPLLALAYRSAGWSTPRLLLALPAHLVGQMACFAAGTTAMLLLLRLLRRARPEVVFLSMFLGSVWILVAVLNLDRWEWGAAVRSALGVTVAGVERYGPAALLGRLTATSAPFAPAAVLLLAGLASLLLAFAGTAERALTAAYVVAHRRGGAAGDAPLPERPPRFGYSRVSRALRFLPVAARALLTRDVLFVARNPHLWARVLSAAVPLLLLPYLGSKRVDDPAALAIYLFAAFVGARLFLDSGAADFGAGPSVRRSFASSRGYLGARLLIVVVSTLLLLAPVVAALAWWGRWGTFGAVRVLLLAADVTVASALLIPFSALLARRSAGAGGSASDQHPGALLLFWGLGSVVPFFFYRLDLALRGRALLGIAGALAGTAALVFVVALNAWAAATCFRRAEPLAKS